MIERTILALVILLICLVPIVGQDDDPVCFTEEAITATQTPFNCLSDYQLQWRVSGEWVDMDMSALAVIEGESIWVGYANGGWKFDGKTYPHSHLYNEARTVEVWIWYSLVSEMFYVFVFDDLTITIQSDGVHGIHPCGQGEISPDDLFDAIVWEG